MLCYWVVGDVGWICSGKGLVFGVCFGGGVYGK